jgi:hypothetical protein
MTRFRSIVLGIPLLACAAMAHADPAAPAARGSGNAGEKLGQRFAQADINHDGRLSLAEAKAAMPMVAAHFDEIDTAHAGFVSADQIKTFMRARMAQKNVGATK